MRFLRAAHLWLGCLFAPTLLLFAFSGACQLFGIEGSSNGSRNPLAILKILSRIHTNQSLSKSSSDPFLLQLFFFAAAGGLILTTLLGIYMSFRLSKGKMLPLLLLIAGFVIPLVLLLYYRS
jgi:hypothetical protein